MARRTTALTLLGIFLLATGVSACGGAAKPAESPADEGGGGPTAATVGAQAPDLSIQTLNGRGVVSLSSLAGKIAIVEFFSKSCEPCKKSFPVVDELAKKSDGKIKVIAISTDDSKDGVLEFASIASFPVAWDEGHKVAQRWKVEKAPTSYILDGTGTVRFAHEAYQDDERELLTRELAFLENEPPPSSGSGSAVASAEPAPAAPAPAPASKGRGAKGGASPSASASTDAPTPVEEAAAPVPAKKGAKPAAKPKAPATAKKAGKKKKA